MIPKADLIRINVGGTLFWTTGKTLKAIPDTRLSNISDKSAEYINDIETFFFDRNPELFNSVLDYYRTGELHLPKDVCGAAIRNELEFWQISSASIADCCTATIFQFEDEIEVVNQLKEQFETRGYEYTKDELASSKWNRAKNVVWNLLEVPSSSRYARIYSLCYFLLVVMTCITFIMGSHPMFRDHRTVHHNATHTITRFDELLMRYGNEKIALMEGTVVKPPLYYMNNLFMAFFTLELSLRFLSSPRRKLFFRLNLNTLDLVIVISMWIAYILEQHERVTSDNRDSTLQWIFLTAKACIILRLLRLLRLAKHYSGLKILYLALKASSRELGLLLLTFVIASAILGGLIYYAEYFEPSTFKNVPIAMWWAIVTLTTIGYGDYYPVGPWGYIVGGLGGICGLLVLSMPIAVIATNFNEYYTRNKVREKQMQRKRTILSKMKKLFAHNTALVNVDNVRTNTDNKEATAKVPCNTVKMNGNSDDTKETSSIITVQPVDEVKEAGPNKQFKRAYHALKGRNTLK